ncbi:MAG: PilZ domain-containing protein [Deltaproteobacteria bacterium]|nr:PilZ domain-containing protein [Deltaproteobacteria bacterium]
MRDLRAKGVPTRRFPRLPINVSGYIYFIDTGALHSMSVWSLGTGGAGLELRGGMKESKGEVEILINLPACLELVSMKAKVAWWDAPQEAEKHAGRSDREESVIRLGVRFDRGTASDMKILKDFISKQESNLIS